MLSSKIFFCNIAIITVSFALSEGAAVFESDTLFEINEQETQELFDPKNPRLYHLGSIDGKSFFAHNLANGSSWDAAKNYCASAGLKIAKISSLIQQQFLQSKYDTINFRGCFWVAGRDVRNPNQFLWDIDGSSVASSELSFYGYINYLSCMLFISGEGYKGNGQVRSWSCSALTCHLPAGVLCQT